MQSHMRHFDWLRNTRNIRLHFSYKPAYIATYALPIGCLNSENEDLEF